MWQYRRKSSSKKRCRAHRYFVNVLLGLHTFIGTLFGVPWNVTPSAWSYFWSRNGTTFKWWWKFIRWSADKIFGNYHCKKAFTFRRAKTGYKAHSKKEFRKALKKGIFYD